MPETRKTILVIDDERKIRALFAHRLIASGYRVLAAEDSVRALRLLRENGNIALVILDILLPKSSGIDIFDVLKQHFPGMKIIVASVYEKDEQKFLIWDADDYYYKADGLAVLVNKVDGLLNSGVSAKG